MHEIYVYCHFLFTVSISHIFLPFHRGRLEGVRTSTQKFLEMENVDFRYPGSEKNILNAVNLKMSLSSRVAIVGANGTYVHSFTNISNISMTNVLD